MNDLEFIKRFNNITITDICKGLGINQKNVYSGKTTKENLNKVKNELEYEIRKLIFDLDYNKLQNEKMEVIE